MNRRSTVSSMALVVGALGALAAGLSMVGSAQVPERTAIASSDVLSQISMFSYIEGPKSALAFRGTPVAANADGKATVEYEDGNAAISAKVSDLPAPATLGPFTTYVLWAITPDGRAINEGVIAGAEGGKGSLDTTYPSSQFALIVTAEPHFAVTMPSNMIALYNVADKVEGEETKVSQLAARADYSRLAKIAIDEDTSPAGLVQARYAVAIAQAAGAKQYAPDQLASASQKLAAAESAITGKKKERAAAETAAREAVIAGEDARREAMVQTALAQTAEQERAQAEAQTAATATAVAAAALLERLNNALPTRQTDRGLVSEIGGVQFATGTSTLSGSARESLARFAGVVASYPNLSFKIEGHTDDTGGGEKNRELSLRRAISVRDYLIGQGVQASRIDVDGFGPARPIADNSTAEGRARNRRVEIVLSGSPLASR
ncbi:MAG TPA: OmpA family protein [Gammaproteobacteria bacterium]|nr:OmpA family protein [Gammaproteobacteria bacterium]